MILEHLEYVSILHYKLIKNMLKQKVIIFCELFDYQ